jgi:hypothetical protein
VAWGGQVVMSSATATLVGGNADEISLRSLGEQALKEFEGRVELHQVVAPGLPEDFPALRSVPASFLGCFLKATTDLRLSEEILASKAR